MHPAFLYKLLKPILFSLDPETAHSVVTGPARVLLGMPGGEAYLKATLGFQSSRLKVRLSGLDFPGPVGMAAGFDKTGALYPFLSSAGFGFVESGTFTPQGQEGNPRPRLFRFPEQRILINRMGFNNPGMDQAAQEFMAQDRSRKKADRPPRGVNIGKNKVTPNDQAIQDYRLCYERLAPFADYVAVNVSSPNTPGLRDLQSAGFLLELLQELKILEEKAGHAGHFLQRTAPPIFLKLAPDISDADLPQLMQAAADGGAAGLILTNTTISRDFDGLTSAARETQGGLSGALLFARSTELLRRAYEISANRFSLIGVGGIDEPQQGLAKILAGANLVQIYSGYIFSGPMLPSRIARFLDKVCAKEQCNISDLVGKEKEFSHLMGSQ
ncbi:MAG: quinone-dependent dihydroorotate dehydrogenase [Leptospiraceae bacterium]|nr:quinone-dependent dihydroorotate dehydrogenase [Leptospiraceae bacterium]